MSGTNARELISAYLDGELGPEERDAFESAMRADPELRQEHDQTARLARGLSELPEIRAPEDFLARVLAQVDALPGQDDVEIHTPMSGMASANSRPEPTVGGGAGVIPFWTRVRAPLFYAAAAGLALMVGVSVLERQEMGPPKPAALVAASENVGPIAGGSPAWKDDGDGVADGADRPAREAGVPESKRDTRRASGPAKKEEERAVYRAEWEVAAGAAPGGAEDDAAGAGYAPDPPASPPSVASEPAVGATGAVTSSLDGDAVAANESAGDLAAAAFSRSGRRAEAESQSAPEAKKSAAPAMPAPVASVPASSPAADAQVFAQARLSTEFPDVLSRLRAAASSHGWSMRVLSGGGDELGPTRTEEVVEFVLPSSQIDSLGRSLSAYGTFAPPTASDENAGSTRVRVTVVWRP